eukprot:5242566-Alexandrium_andersonii.AAC.1
MEGGRLGCAAAMAMATVPRGVTSRLPRAGVLRSSAGLFERRGSSSSAAGALRFCAASGAKASGSTSTWAGTAGGGGNAC